MASADSTRNTQVLAGRSASRRGIRPPRPAIAPSRCIRRPMGGARKPAPLARRPPSLACRPPNSACRLLSSGHRPLAAAPQACRPCACPGQSGARGTRAGTPLNLAGVPQLGNLARKPKRARHRPGRLTHQAPQACARPELRGVPREPGQGPLSGACASIGHLPPRETRPEQPSSRPAYPPHGAHLEREQSPPAVPPRPA